MEKTYSVSNIAGYSDHLPVERVRLPLKYIETDENPNLNEQFVAKTSNSGDIIELNKNGSYFLDYVSYEILNDLKTIRFTPVLLQPNRLNIKFKRLQVDLPHSVVSSSRVSIQLDTSNPEPTLLVDLIDENYLFITFQLELEDFVIQDSSRLTFDNFDSWGHISVPYSFELRSSPFLVKGTSPNNVFVSLKDGGLLYFDRRSPLDAFDVYNFNNSNYVLPLNFVTGLFSRSRKEVVLNGTSSNSIVDLIAIGDDIIVTLSVTKVLNIWNLRTRNQVASPIELTKDKSIPSVWLTFVPNKYLQVIEDEQTAEKYLIAYYTADSRNQDNETGSTFSAWKISQYKSNAQLTQLDHLTFRPELPDLLIDPDVTPESQKKKNFSSIWLIQDYQTQFFGDSIRYHILWKSNTSSIVVSYLLDFNDGSKRSINWSHTELNTLSEFSPQHNVDYYANKILNHGIYDNLTVTTALNIFRKHAKLDTIKNFDRHSIRQAIYDTIRETSFSDPKTSWYNLDLLCEEFKKSSHEVLALSLTNRASMLTLQVNGIGVIRPSHYYESFPFQKISSNEGRLASLLISLTQRLSTKTYNKLYQNISNINTLGSAEATELYETYLLNKIGDSDAQAIMLELESIPNILEITDSLIEPIRSDIIEESSNSSEPIGLFSKLNTMITFKNIKFQHETLLLNLLVVFLICEANEQVLLLINRIIEKLNTYSLVDLVFNTSFSSSEPSSRIESKNLNNLEYSLFWNGVANKNNIIHNFIQDKSLNNAYDGLYMSITSNNYNNFIVDIITELINHNEGSIIEEKIFSKLNASKPIDKFLFGLIHLINNKPINFFEIFQDYSVFEKVNKPAIKEKLLKSLTENKNIQSFLNSIFIQETNPLILKYNYFHALSELSKNQISYQSKRISNLQKLNNSGIAAISFNDSQTENQFIENALNFERIAIITLKTESDGNDENLIKAKLEEFYMNIFEMALEISSYDLIYDSLLNLKPTLTTKIYRSLFAKLINNLITNKNISVIFPPNKNDLYRDNFLLIDSVILEVANSELTLSKSLKCYEYLYSWRLFGASNDLGAKNMADKRSAIEALYMFITRFRFEQSNLLTLSTSEDIKQYNLKILEVYIIIVNCLKSFSKDEDKWLLSQSKNNQTTITTLDQINIEYYEWLKLLDHDMNS